MKLSTVWAYGAAICVSWSPIAGAITLDLDSTGITPTRLTWLYPRHKLTISQLLSRALPALLRTT